MYIQDSDYDEDEEALRKELAEMIDSDENLSEGMDLL